MKASTKILKAKLSSVIEQAWQDPAVIDTLGASQAKSMCHVFLEAYKGVIYESSLVKDMGRHLDVEEIRTEALQRADAAVESARIERQRADDTDKLAREAVELYEGERRKREAVEAELEGAQALLAAAGDHPDYASLLADYKRLLARAIERGWERMTAIP